MVDRKTMNTENMERELQNFNRHSKKHFISREYTMPGSFTSKEFTAEEFAAKVNQIDEALSKYYEAVRNYESLSQKTLESVPPGHSLFGPPEELIDTPHYIPSPWLLDRLLRRPKVGMMQYAVQNQDDLPQTMPQESLQFRKLDAAGSAAREKVPVLERFSFVAFGGALFGGLAPMTPVLIISLYPGRNTALTTSWVAIILFAFTLTFRGNGKDILTATAAYAAVLVVFMGTSATPTSGWSESKAVLM